MKILQIANYRKGVGGISGQVEILQKKLQEEGLVCEVISTKGSAIRRIRAFFHILSWGKDYDVLHIHACSGRGFFPAVVGVTAGCLLHKRIVLTYHGGGAAEFFAQRTSLVKYFLTRTSANIALSGFVGHIFDRYGIPYTVIPNIIELDESHFRVREAFLPHFISIRTLEETYNIRCTLLAFQAVKKSLPEATLDIVGDGPQRSELEALVKERDIRDVTFVGRVNNQEIYSYLDCADIMISSSRVDNMPVSVLECFNAGLLVISSKVGGVPYMIEDGVNGLLYNFNDETMLVEKMLWGATHHQECKQIIANAKSSLQQYSWASVREKLFRVYQQH